MIIFQLVVLIGLKDGLGVSEMGIFYTKYHFLYYRWQDVRKINADSTGLTIYTFSGRPKTIPSSYFGEKDWDELTSQITTFAMVRKIEFHSEFKL